jgi:hypothetical protein
MCFLPPGDGPLLSTDKLSSLAWGRDFRDVDRDLGRADADTEAIDYTADDEHGNVLRGGDDNASNDPNDGSNLNGDLACEVRTKVRVDCGIEANS